MASRYRHTWKNVLNTFLSNWINLQKIVKIDGLPENVVPITRVQKI